MTELSLTDVLKKDDFCQRMISLRLHAFRLQVHSRQV